MYAPPFKRAMRFTPLPPVSVRTFITSVAMGLNSPLFTMPDAVRHHFYIVHCISFHYHKLTGYLLYWINFVHC